MQLYFPPGNRETFQWWIQIGSDVKFPTYPVEGQRQTYALSKQGRCLNPLSLQTHRSLLSRFAGHDVDSKKHSARAFFALMDVEKICNNHAQMTGENTFNGKTIYAFFHGLMTGKEVGEVDGATEPEKERGVTMAYIHTEHETIVSMSSAGVEKED